VKYRILRPREIIMDGDEYQDPITSDWVLSGNVGELVGESRMALRYRRPIRASRAA